MGNYTDLDVKAINTIRTLAVSSRCLSVLVFKLPRRAITFPNNLTMMFAAKSQSSIADYAAL